MYQGSQASGKVVLKVDSNGLTIDGKGTFSGALSIGSTFSVTEAGYLTATSGNIAGWTIN
jgi:hypothetical protein